jgi:hypothetical protein
VIGVNVTFEYDGEFDRARVIAVAENARGMVEGMPGLRCSSSPSTRSTSGRRTSTSGTRKTQPRASSPRSYGIE